jgi:hypothetical protein
MSDLLNILRKKIADFDSTHFEAPLDSHGDPKNPREIIAEIRSYLEASSVEREDLIKQLGVSSSQFWKFMAAERNGLFAAYANPTYIAAAKFLARNQLISAIQVAKDTIGTTISEVNPTRDVFKVPTQSDAAFKIPILLSTIHSSESSPNRRAFNAAGVKRSISVSSESVQQQQYPSKRPTHATGCRCELCYNNAHPEDEISFVLLSLKQHQHQQQHRENHREQPQLQLQHAPVKAACTPICKCLKSRCLKLYCDCFAASQFCHGKCSCSDCYNIKEQVQVRRQQ